MAFLSTAALVFFVFSGVARAEITPNDPLFGEQWYLKQIQAPEAWERGAGEREVVIAVLDSGIDMDHPDLQNNIWLNRKERLNAKDDDGNGYIDDFHGWDFVDKDADPSPSFSPAYTDKGLNHGTLNAGLIAAQGNNIQGIAGVCWRCMLMPLRVLDSMGMGSSANVIKAIDYAIKNGADVINLSFVSKDPSDDLRWAIERAYKAGIIVVAAAGNDKDNNGNSLDLTKEYPVCYDGPEGENWVLGVVATDVLDQRALFSSYGKSCVDLAAPGMDLIGTAVFDKTHRGFSEFYRAGWSGTSLAAALVSGAAALLKSFAPDLTNKEVYDFLRAGTDDISSNNPGFEGQLGTGRLNIKKTLDLVARQENTPASPLPKSAYGAYLVEATESGDKSAISIIEQIGEPRVTFYPYEKFSGGINVALGNVLGDSSSEIVVGTAAGAGPQVRVFSAEGRLQNEFWAFDEKRRSGVNVAVGDFLGYGTAQIATAEDARGTSRVRFWVAGEPWPRREIQVFKEPWKGGVRLFAADTNLDGQDELIVVPAASVRDPEVKIYRSDGVLLTSFAPLPAGFYGILEVVPGQFNDFGYVDLAIAAKKGGDARIFIWSSDGRMTDPSFFAFPRAYRGGLSLAVSDTNGDGRDEIIVAPRKVVKNGEIRIWSSGGKLLGAVKPKNTALFKHGVNLSILVK